MKNVSRRLHSIRLLTAWDYGYYGATNPGYAPAVQGSPAMFAPPASDFQGPSAPPASMFDSVPGYEGTVAGGGGGFLPPPIPSVPAPQPQPGPGQSNWDIPSISESTAREALAKYVSSKCCWSSGPVKDGVITNMETFNTYRYRLETFTEQRVTEWSQQPYLGQPVDAYTQPPPGPWNIPAKTPTFFQNETQIIKVPNTSSVKNCHTCLGMGRNPCKECVGVGNKICWVCKGAGDRASGDRCHHCQGRGRENCNHCHGQGSKECQTCKGKQQLLVFINLKVIWTNNLEDYVVEQSSGLHMANLSNVSGKEMFRDSQYMVYPVMGFPNPDLVHAAERLVREHQAKFSQTSRILQQRQSIELIPITKVSYKWKGASHVYFVFGNEYMVNADSYPATCCCTVM
ncbi:protein SSUH2 homolog isoform X1 [Esox lucius]|uniref:Protein SSUH2 homolog n=1 Tax=Esox lucius TaxID=8010 RepID=A0AAY5K8T3_ESOLU|nr:protein SSUH2 homolog isoform X1 [Esox lucius]